MMMEKLLLLLGHLGLKPKPAVKDRTMVKYYTRACNFYYGNQANELIKKKSASTMW